MKKIVKISLFTLIFSLFLFESNAQKNKIVEIQTSAQCEMCKESLESSLAFEKGVKDVKLDMETKKLIITFKPGKTDIRKLKNAISKIGYDADDVTANLEIYNGLPSCCKKPEDR